MHAILIDPVDKSIRAVETDGTLDDIYRLTGCANIEGVVLSDRELVYVDEEGLLVDRPGPFFVLAGHPHPIAGRGLILGYDASGESQPTELSVPEVFAAVEFPDIELVGFTFESGEVVLPDGRRIPAFGSAPEFRKKDG